MRLKYKNSKVIFKFVRNCFVFVFLTMVWSSFSQKKVLKKFTSNLKEITILTEGLDDFVLENSNTNFIEITLFAKNSDEQHIVVQEKNNEIQIEFKLDKIQEKEIIFRKFITERLQRANAIIKVPKGKKVIIFGNNVDIESKDFKNDLKIYIENGIVKLNEIKANTQLKLYSGLVYAATKDANVDVISNNGKIKVDTVFYQKKYQKKEPTALKKLTITSLKANIFLTAQ
ncbi:MAG: putative ribonuclease YlaK [Polaribacter sp.]